MWRKIYTLKLCNQIGIYQNKFCLQSEDLPLRNKKKKNDDKRRHMKHRYKEG